MSFTFTSPEGSVVTCDTLEELTAGYEALWREHRAAMYMPLGNPLAAMESVAKQAFPEPGDFCGEFGYPSDPHVHVGDVVFEEPRPMNAPTTDPEQPIIMLTSKRKEVFEALLEFGSAGTTFNEIKDILGIPESSLRTKWSCMAKDGYIEHVPRRTHYWRVPEQYQNARVYVHRRDT